MAISTAMPTSAKQEFLQGAHNFNGPVTSTCTNVSGAFTLTSMSTTVGIGVGMAISGNANIPAGTVVASIDSATQVTMSKASTGTITAQTITFTGDVFKIVLIKHTPAGTYGAASVNYTDITGNSDEASGTGYSAGGLAMTNVTPSINASVAITNFSPNPSWAGATLDVDGCMIDNSNVRLGAATYAAAQNRAVYVGDFGGEQKVTAGTLTITMPTADSTHAVLRIS